MENGYDNIKTDVMISKSWNQFVSGQAYNKDGFIRQSIQALPLMQTIHKQTCANWMHFAFCLSPLIIGVRCTLPHLYLDKRVNDLSAC